MKKIQMTMEQAKAIFNGYLKRNQISYTCDINTHTCYEDEIQKWIVANDVEIIKEQD